MGLRPILMRLMVYVEWERIFDIYHIFGHMLPRLSSLLANSILENGPCALEIVLQNDFHILRRAILLIHTGPLNDLSIEGRDL